ncbi:hypothetical protein GCM10010112_56210 [Actinoplanes lobatus]|uniref:DUF2786 domain-containing protein n=1 Tax=Actinoplanes lobatus TaxID=113568 RepID=A0A7W7HCK2_9ACTN|nr:DUF2786 domain-containing protein [Actinoplanes lobatus]MBB4748060.1 hypothetical protein [Actinoplanes lobatus]GGN80549.1 hypothetical protein GCM10010112_56210 [Actinoplanes lobatus]GIE41473.1 hypothetical protein Alo02nite_43710 [Actinoplanes lobatus]
MSDALLARVRKLLAMAEDPACMPGEAEAFTAKAAELIAKYGVDQAMLAAEDPTADPVGDRVVTVDPPYARDKAGLLAAVAAPMRCRVVHLERRGLARSHLFGHTADLERVELLFTSLLVQAAHGLAASPVPEGEHAAAYRRSWMAGYTQAISGRLWAAERSAAAGTPGAEIVLVDRTDLVERRRDEAYPRLARMRPRRLRGGGILRGFQAGQAAHLGGTEVTGVTSL